MRRREFVVLALLPLPTTGCLGPERRKNRYLVVRIKAENVTDVAELRRRSGFPNDLDPRDATDLPDDSVVFEGIREAVETGGRVSIHLSPGEAERARETLDDAPPGASRRYFRYDRHLVWVGIASDG